MLRVGILGETESARRKAALVMSSDVATLVDQAADAAGLIASCDMVVLTDGDGRSRTDLAAEALRRGCHVFSDWPIAANAESARVLSQTADEAGVQIAVNRPDRHHPVVGALQSRGPTLTDVTIVADAQSDIENLLADAVDLCMYLNGRSGVHKYEAETIRNEAGTPIALSFALRFHTGSLALGHARTSGGEPTRTIVAGGNGWLQHEDLLMNARDGESEPYDPWTDEYPFLDALEKLAAGQPARAALHDLEETIRILDAISRRMRGGE